MVYVYVTFSYTVDLEKTFLRRDILEKIFCSQF